MRNYCQPYCNAWLVRQHTAFVAFLKRLRRPLTVIAVVTAIIALFFVVVAFAYWREVAQVRLNGSLAGAVIHSNFTRVHSLLQQGADPNTRRKSISKDISTGEIFKRIIDHLFQPQSAALSDGRPVLLYAINARSDFIVEELLERGADPNVYGDDEMSPTYAIKRSPLALGVIMGYPRICSMLLHHSARPDASDGSGMTPLTTAVILYLHVDELVMSNPRPEVRLDAAWYWLCRNSSDDDLAEFEREPEDYWRYLRSICMENIRLLVQNHANPEIKDATGKSAMDYAKAAHNRELEDILKGSLTPAIK